MEWLINHTTPDKLRELGYSGNYSDVKYEGFVGWGDDGTDQVTLSDGKTIYLTDAQRYLIQHAHELNPPITNEDLQNIVKTCPTDENTTAYQYLMNSDGGWVVVVLAQCMSNAKLNDSLSKLQFQSTLDTTDYNMFANYWNEVPISETLEEFHLICNMR